MNIQQYMKTLYDSGLFTREQIETLARALQEAIETPIPAGLHAVTLTEEEYQRFIKLATS